MERGVEKGRWEMAMRGGELMGSVWMSACLNAMFGCVTL